MMIESYLKTCKGLPIRLRSSPSIITGPLPMVKLDTFHFSKIYLLDKNSTRYIHICMDLNLFFSEWFEFPQDFGDCLQRGTAT